MDYSDIYKRMISLNANGLKLISGGTGLGKTRGVAEIIKSRDIDRKFIYCANRHQLIHNMELEIKGIPFIRLRDNVTVVQNAILLEKEGHSILELLDKKEVYRWAGSDPQKREKVRQSIKNVKRLMQTEIKHPASIFSYDTQTILRYFQSAVRASTQSKKAKATDKPANQTSWMLDDPVIQELFPFIAFKRRPEIRVLLTTVQKGFSSFFDGERNTDLSHLRAGKNGYIIFLDEFDFLEPDLLRIICQTPLIDDPFEFVELFYDEMKRHKLPYEGYATKEVQDYIALEIIQYIDQISEDFGIRYPQLNQFTTQIKNQQPAIFTTSRTHLNRNVYLRQGIRSFEILDQRLPGSVEAVKVFQVVYSATQKILAFLVDLRETNTTLYREILRQCYGRSDFQKQVESIKRIGRRYTESAYTQLDTLLDEGYAIYEVNRLNETSDKQAAEFRYYSILTTPDKMLRDLIRNNLVFALSATADIPRIVKHFDMEWLENQPGVRVFPTDKFDIDIILGLNREKADIRQTKVEVQELPPLDLSQPLHRDVQAHCAEVIRFGTPSREGDDITPLYRQQRIEMFYQVLLWARDHAVEAPNTHLIFVNSFVQIQSSLSIPSRVISAEPLQHQHGFDIYQINDFDKYKAIVIFYNAETARSLERDPANFDFYQQQFWKGLPVFLVTQHSSAGNGVNLQYLPSPQAKDEIDFTHIHLLEAPYYFFNGWDESSQDTPKKISSLKQDIWYCAKLYVSGALSEGQFLRILNNLRQAGVNSQYHLNPATRFDRISNQVAALIQACGRIERVREPIPMQIFMLSEGVKQIFQEYCTQPEFDFIREGRNALISNNLHQLQLQIQASTEAQNGEAIGYANSRLARANSLSIEAIDGLLKQIQRLRKGHSHPEARDNWIQLREIALHHHFDHDLIKKYYGSCETNHYHQGVIWVDEDLSTYPVDKRSSDAEAWDFGRIYRTIRQNPIIENYFNQKGYALSFPKEATRIPTRYFYQAILVGAIGEEAIRSILKLEIDMEEIEDTLFEIADLKVANQPWYIDCKNYGEFTLDQFSYEEDEAYYHPKLNSRTFLKRAQEKIVEIEQYHEYSTVKLIYLNLFSYTPRQASYFTRELDEARGFADAQIIIIPSVLAPNAPQDYTSDFLQLAPMLRDWR